MNAKNTVATAHISIVLVIAALFAGAEKNKDRKKYRILFKHAKKKPHIHPLITI